MMLCRSRGENHPQDISARGKDPAFRQRTFGGNNQPSVRDFDFCATVPEGRGPGQSKGTDRRTLGFSVHPTSRGRSRGECAAIPRRSPPIVTAHLVRPQAQEASQGHDELAIYPLNQSGNDVFGFFPRVVRRPGGFDGILGHLNIVPRVDFYSFLDNRTLEKRTAQSLDVLQGGLALGAGEALKEIVPMWASYSCKVTFPK